MENDLESDIESIVPQTLQDAMMDFILTGLQRHVSATEEKDEQASYNVGPHFSIKC